MYIWSRGTERNIFRIFLSPCEGRRFEIGNCLCWTMRRVMEQWRRSNSKLETRNSKQGILWYLSRSLKADQIPALPEGIIYYFKKQETRNKKQMNTFCC